MKLVNADITKHQRIAQDIYEIHLKGDFDISEMFAGQFVNIQIPNTSCFLRRPFSIVDMVGNTMVLVYRIAGRGTLALRSCQLGESLSVLGPLGHPFPLVNNRCALIGGGIGVVPLYGLAKTLIQANIDCQLFMGYQGAPSVIYKDKFEALAPLTIATMDGSIGYKGTILETFNPDNFDTIYACGPHGLLKAIQTKYPDKTIYLSLEARMACGFGVCNACVCQDDTNQTVLICKDGPVFDGKKVKL